MGRYTNILLLIILPFLTLVSGNIYAQEEEEKPVLLFSGKVTNTSGAKLAGVSVKFLKNESEFQTELTASSGKYKEVVADYGYVYKVVFSKEGYVSKTVIIDTKKGFFAEDIAEQKTFLPTIGTSMIKQQPNIDYSVITNRPVAKAHIDPSLGELGFDLGYIKTRKKEIDKFIAGLANKANESDQEFIQLVQAGDNLVKSKQYENAIVKYKVALRIRADDKVTVKIANAQKELEELETQNQLLEEFNRFIKKGDQLLALNDFDGSISEYNKAKGIKSGDALPDEKIKAANDKRKLADSAALYKQYNNKMKEANMKFNAKKLVEADKLYKEALLIKPNETDPKDKIAEIEAILNASKELEENYNKLIASGDLSMEGEKYDEAISIFANALTLKKAEAYPKEQMAKAKELSAKKAKEIAQKKKYDDLISKGNGEFSNESWASAKLTFKEALTIFPNEQLPKDKIIELDAKLNQIAASNADRAAQQKKYDNLISKANEEFLSESWASSKLIFKEALTVFPNEQLPKDKIAEIDAKLKDLEEFKEAKEASVAAEKIKKDEFDNLMASGNAKLEEKEFNEAKTSFSDASKIYPKSAVAKSKLLEVNSKIAAEVAEKELTSKYNQIITQADAARDAESWDPAKELYKSANKEKPSESYPQEQIDWINDKMKSQSKEDLNKQYQKIIDVADKMFGDENYTKATELYERAGSFALADDYPSDKIVEIKQILADNMATAEKEKQYSALIAKADNQFESENWSDARSLYGKASEVLDKQYPKDKIVEIDSKISEGKNKQKAYDQLILKADGEFSTEDWEKAKGNYEKALVIFANDYPKKQIAIIVEKLRYVEESSAIDKKYNNKIVPADAARDAKNWDPAKKLYKEANVIKPSESYPQEQIDFINDEMKTALDGEVDKQYQKIIDVADKLLGEADYLKSKELYQRANEMKPRDSYPPGQIKKLNGLIAKNNKQNKLYSSYIKSGNSEFKKGSYKVALESYKNALNIKPKANYPQEKIDEVNGLLNQLAEEKANQKKIKPVDFVENPYGDEVTGKYTEEDVKLMMTTARIEGNNLNPEIIKKVKDDEAKKLQVNFDYQLDQVDKNYALSEENETKMSEFSKDSDIQREENVNSLEHFQEKSLAIKSILEETTLDKNYNTFVEQEEFLTQINEDIIELGNNRDDDVQSIKDYMQGDYLGNEDRIDFGTDRTYDNELANEIMETRIADYSSESDDNREENVQLIEDYQQGGYSENGDRIGFGIDRTHDNELANETMETRSSMYLSQSDDNREDNVKSMEDYLQIENLASENRIDVGSDRTYENELSNETLETRISQFSSELDDHRQDNVESMDDYREGDHMVHEDRMDFGTDRTYDNELANENMETRISEFSIESDENLQEKVESMEDQKQEGYMEHGDRIGFGNDRTYDNELANETMETRITEGSDESDEHRQENVESMDDYMQGDHKKNGKRIGFGADKAYDNELANEEMETRIADFSIDADDARERNAEAIGNYEDGLKDENSESSNRNKDVIIDNANEMDRVKNQSPTMFVDENQQKLATQYPEGITEKMFERRNGRGDVIEVTILRIIIKGVKGNEYKKVATKWGTNYFKNGGVISEYIWDTETN